MENLRRLSVLRVDHEAGLPHDSARVLERAGFATRSVSSGEQALEVIRSSRPDLLLLGRDLPGLGGLEVCRRIKADPALADVVVIIMSGADAQSGEQADCLSTGADGFIVRPFSEQELLARMEDFDRIWRLGHALRETDAELGALKLSLTQRRIAELNMLEDAVASQRKAETTLAALRESEEIFTHFMENSPIYVFFKDEKMRSIRLSRNFEQMLGRPLDELLGKNMNELFPSDLAASMVVDDMKVLRDGRQVSVEEELGGRFYWTTKFPILIDGTPRFLAGYTIDITERRAADARIARLAVLYAAISQCNEAIVRSSGEAEMFATICRIAVQFGGMKMAWIGMIDPLAQTIRSAASFGAAGREYLKEINISTDSDSPIGRGPTGTALREDRQIWCQDFQNDPFTAPWHALAARVGFRSSSALPLHRNGAVVGALMLYSGQINAFDEEARKLLAEMAADISFALDNFSRDAAREKARDELRAAEEQFRGLVEKAIAGIFIIQDGRLAYVNPRFAELHGFDSVDELIGHERYSLIAEQDRGSMMELHRRLLAGEVKNLSAGFTALRKDGAQVELGVSIARGNFHDRPAIIGMAQDITEKKRAEDEIRRYVAELELAFMSSVQVATRLIELRDPYTAGHQRRVAAIAVAIGAEMQWSERRQEGLRVAGHLHDIGQITIPAEVLSKPGRLSTIAYQLVQGHAQAGYDVLKDVKFPWPVAEVALQHHERIDGSGYPQGLKGESIIFEARIIAIADVVEAMASHRPYRAALGIEKALEEIERGRAIRYDPTAADACLRLFRDKGYRIPE
ncbi:MAG: HD domain-containing phosphohydrolase [Rhodoferax sp.]